MSLARTPQLKKQAVGIYHKPNDNLRVRAIAKLPYEVLNIVITDTHDIRDISIYKFSAFEYRKTMLMIPPELVYWENTKSRFVTNIFRNLR